MSFRINSNISAMMAYNDVSRVTGEMNTSMSKLSKGLRIRDAGDDPSGLISSEMFRSHITSMDAAVRNNQEAINYSKTAESALGEVNKLLNEARALAITSGNRATLSATQLAANQDQMNSIISTINRISSSTAYGTRRLLDGSAGVTTQISNSAKVSGFSFTGMANSVSITSSGLVTINQTVLATRANITSGVTLATGARQNGTVIVNGVSFNFAQGTAGTAMAATLNASSSQTGVTANYNTTTNFLTLTHNESGSNRKIEFADTTGVMSTTGNFATSALGTDAVASIAIGGQTVLYTGGKNGADGLLLTDINGNNLRITDGGNAVNTQLLGRVSAGNSQFQIGYLTTATANLALRNMAAAQLGTGAVTGQNLSTIDLTSANGPTDALSILDKAIDEVSQMRGQVGMSWSQTTGP
jgi:flagellin